MIIAWPGPFNFTGSCGRWPELNREGHRSGPSASSLAGIWAADGFAGGRLCGPPTSWRPACVVVTIGKLYR